MDVPYLMHVPDCDELWLVDGEQRLLITPRIYDLLASNGADLTPAYGIEELREQNAKLRELAQRADRLLTSLFQYIDYSRCTALEAVAAWRVRARELGVEVDG